MMRLGPEDVLMTHYQFSCLIVSEMGGLSEEVRLTRDTYTGASTTVEVSLPSVRGLRHDLDWSIDQVP